MTVRRTDQGISNMTQVTAQVSDGTFEELLLQLCLCDLDLNSLVHLLGMSLLVVGIVLDGGGEQRVDEGGLSQPRLSRNLDAFVSRFSQQAFIGEWEPTMIVKAAPRFATILCLVHPSDLRFPPFTSTVSGACKHTAGWGATAAVIVSNGQINDARDRKTTVN